VWNLGATQTTGEGWAKKRGKGMETGTHQRKPKKNFLKRTKMGENKAEEGCSKITNWSKKRKTSRQGRKEKKKGGPRVFFRGVIMGKGNGGLLGGGVGGGRGGQGDWAPIMEWEGRSGIGGQQGRGPGEEKRIKQQKAGRGELNKKKLRKQEKGGRYPGIKGPEKRKSWGGTHAKVGGHRPPKKSMMRPGIRGKGKGQIKRARLGHEKGDGRKVQIKNLSNLENACWDQKDRGGEEKKIDLGREGGGGGEDDPKIERGKKIGWKRAKNLENRL